MSDSHDKYGWTAVPRSQSVLLKDAQPKDPEPLKVSDIDLPSSPVIDQVHEYAKKNLPEETYNHSMRVFYYGQALVKQHFKQFAPSTETYFLTCLLHDIGTTPTNLKATDMSFEFYGGFLSLNLLNECGAPKPQAESVCEAIIRHQDLGETGMISTVGQLIQLATVFDNIGQNPQLVHKETIEDVVKAYPRKGWSGCFAKTIREEVKIKPWCHTTVIEGFAEGVEGNKLMEPYD
ncbi:hypothetical protein H2201_000449 [Coniosporium apollinis]|uniref:HD domain-containing protein n=1 Tax=Coniosporium apollinis TaxID=61459 RepID=A0ABQ9P5E0_9PEZI|nr:hypothetical protein H2201_000449 [Coniosporium apollinis]